MGSTPKPGSPRRTWRRPRPTAPLIKVARRVVVLADHTKWGVVSLASFATLDEVNVLVTDNMLPTEAHATLRPARSARSLV